MASHASRELTEAILNKDSSNLRGLFEKSLFSKIHNRLEEKRDEMVASFFGEEVTQDDESEEDSEKEDDNVEIEDGEDSEEEDD